MQETVPHKGYSSSCSAVSYGLLCFLQRTLNRTSTIRYIVGERVKPDEVYNRPPTMYLIEHYIEKSSTSITSGGIGGWRRTRISKVDAGNPPVRR